jgi:hypothetical protein
MVERHEREIAPLLKRRWLFAESSNFRLYDFFCDNGSVDENVFAYSNRSGAERAVVVYNNHYGETHGTIDFSAAYADKGAGQLRQQRIREGLELSGNPAVVLAWRDSLTGLEYLRRAGDFAERGLTLDLHAYQCHVFLGWRELYSTAEQPWDRLSDRLNGRGVANLEDALVNLELQPVHEALRALLEPGMVRLFAGLAGDARTVAAGNKKKSEAGRREFFAAAWGRCENFLRQAQRAYLVCTGQMSSLQAAAHPANPGLLSAAFRERLRAALRIPVVEDLFPAPWTVAARRVLPSLSPQLTATAIWGPVLGWCSLELLAESIDRANPGGVALDLFDRLRLREPFGQAFAALGFEGEEAWRVAARIKVLLLAGAGVGKPQEKPAEASFAAAEPTVAAKKQVAAPKAAKAASKAAAAASSVPAAPEPTEVHGQPAAPSSALWPALWLDPDVRWLTGVHAAEGHDYLVREDYEELLWWLQLPSLLCLAGEAAPSPAAIEQMSGNVEEALASAESAGYRVDRLIGPAAAEAAGGEPASGPIPEPVSGADSGSNSSSRS